MISYEEALDLIRRHVGPLGAVEVATARCCGRVLADKYLAYLKIVADEGGSEEPDVYYYATKKSQKSAHGRALDKLHIHSNCCRTYMLAQPRT